MALEIFNLFFLNFTGIFNTSQPSAANNLQKTFPANHTIQQTQPTIVPTTSSLQSSIYNPFMSIPNPENPVESRHKDAETEKIKFREKQAQMEAERLKQEKIAKQKEREQTLKRLEEDKRLREEKVNLT